MTLEQYLEILKPEVEKLFKGDQSGHDISHLERTLKTALHIQSKEGGDRVVVGISAYMHDIHRVISIEGKDFASPKDSLPKAKRILKKLNLEKETLDKILECIEYHECYNWSDPDNANRSKEVHIVQDADNLDSAGAMGVIRSFVYGTMYGIPMFDANQPLVFDKNYIEDHITKESSLHYVYKKCSFLDKSMNTRTGKKLSKPRTKFIKKFIKQFIAEHECNF